MTYMYTRINITLIILWARSLTGNHQDGDIDWKTKQIKYIKDHFAVYNGMYKTL